MRAKLLRPLPPLLLLLKLFLRLLLMQIPRTTSEFNRTICSNDYVFWPPTNRTEQVKTCLHHSDSPCSLRFDVRLHSFCSTLWQLHHIGATSKCDVSRSSACISANLELLLDIFGIS